MTCKVSVQIVLNLVNVFVITFIHKWIYIAASEGKRYPSINFTQAHSDNRPDRRITWRIGAGALRHELRQSRLNTSLRVFRRKRNAAGLLCCSSLGVGLRLFLYEHSRSIAYPAAKVQAGDPQGDQTVPRLHTRQERPVKSPKSHGCKTWPIEHNAM